MAEIIEGLMCGARVDIAQICKTHHIMAAPIEALAREALNDMPGLGRLDGSCLSVAAPEYARLLAARLDPAFSASEAAFSMAS